MQMILSRVRSSDIKNGTFKIPKDVTEIAQGAFLNCEGLKELEIPKGVTKIGDYAFWHCGDLERVVIPYSVDSFGNGMFEGCVNLKEVIIQDEKVRAVVSKKADLPCCCVKVFKNKTTDECRVK